MSVALRFFASSTAYSSTSRSTPWVNGRSKRVVFIGTSNYAGQLLQGFTGGGRPLCRGTGVSPENSTLSPDLISNISQDISREAKEKGQTSKDSLKICIFPFLLAYSTSMFALF